MLLRHRFFAVQAEVAIEADLPDDERARRWKAIWKSKQKRRGPNNAGMSGDVYENKERRKIDFGESGDVYENKQFS